MFFESWTSVARTALTGVLSYAALVAFLRVSGSRTLGKMNAFDLVITVALGSTLSTIIVSRDVPLAEGILALLLLILLQFAVAWTCVRSPTFEQIVKSAPSLLLYRGELRDDEMRRQRVSEGEIRSAVRSAGFAEPREIGAVVLETDGSFSVIPPGALPAGSTDELPGISR